MKKIYFFLFIYSFIICLSATEPIIIAGAGPSTWIVSAFYNVFQKEINAFGYSFIIPIDSIKHKGGVDSCNHNLFGRTGRSLNEEEKKLGKKEILLASIPAVFGVGKMVNIESLTIDEIEHIFTGKIKNWNQVKGIDHEIYVIGREAEEVLFSDMKKKYPFFEKSIFSEIVTKDNYVTDMLNSPKGDFAIAFGSKLNFVKSKIKIVKVPDFHAETNLGLVYNLSNSSHPLVLKIKELAKSKKWHDYIENAGYNYPEN